VDGFVAEAGDDAWEEETEAVDGYQDDEEVDGHRYRVDVEEGVSHGEPGEVLFLHGLGVRGAVKIDAEAVCSVPLLFRGEEGAFGWRVGEEEERDRGDDYSYGAFHLAEEMCQYYRPVSTKGRVNP